MSEAKYYTSIVDLPLRKFIECKCAENGPNLAMLIIEGIPSLQELNAAWLDIQQEYADAMNDSEQKLYIATLKDVSELSVNYDKLQLVIPFLMKIPFDILHHVEGAFEQVVEGMKVFTTDINKILRTSYKFDPTNQEQYQKELKRCLKMSVTLKMRYQVKSSELNALRATQENAEHKPTKEFFISTLITLKDFSKVPLDEEKITVYEFCERIRRYNKYREEKAAEARKQQSKHG